MITAAVTAAVGGFLSLFGIKPGPYLVGVAVVVKVGVVAAGVMWGGRAMRRRSLLKRDSESARTPNDETVKRDPPR